MGLIEYRDKTSNLVSRKSFTRTSHIIGTILGVSKIKSEKALRERNFGELELRHEPDDVYLKIWLEDSKDPDHGIWGVESANSIMKRTTELVAKLEKLYIEETILLVSHGDTLQILQCGFDGFSAAKHKDVTSFKVAEIREFTLVNAQK
jgi:broad specificity phosphatase PhoE